MRDVGQYYVHHLYATAGTPELLRRALDRAILDLERGEIERFTRRMSRLRRSLRLEARQGPVAATLLRAFVGAARAARASEPGEAKALLQPLLDVTEATRPRPALA